MKITAFPGSWSPCEKCLDSAKDQCLNHTFTSGTSESKTANDKEAQLEDCKVGAGDWLAQNFDPSKDFNMANCQIHRSAEFMPRQPTKVTRTTLIMEPALIEPTNGTNCPKQFHQSQHNHGQTNHCKVIGNIMRGDISKTQGTTIGGGYLRSKAETDGHS